MINYQTNQLSFLHCNLDEEIFKVILLLKSVKEINETFFTEKMSEVLTPYG